MRASPVLGPTAAVHLGLDTGKEDHQSLSATCSHNDPHSPISAPETLTLGSCHQAELKTPHPHLLHHHPAFPDTSALWEEGCELPHAGVDCTLEHEEEFPCGPALSL